MHLLAATGSSSAPGIWAYVAVFAAAAGTVFVVSVGAGAYGVGKVSAGHHDPASLAMLIGGVAVAVLCIVLVRRRIRRHQARLPVAGRRETLTADRVGRLRRFRRGRLHQPGDRPATQR